MSRQKKLNIILPVILILFAGAFSWHRYTINQITVAGRLQDKEMDEVSGMAASTIIKDMYYVHNDSGDTSRFFLISPNGTLHSTIYYHGEIKGPFGIDDCEDIAVGPGPGNGKSYVYIGDIGDNEGWRKCITIYRVEENMGWLKNKTAQATAVPLHLKYPDGPKDAETLMVDPVEKLFYIVSKRGDTVSVYTSPLTQNPNDTLVMTKRCKLFFEGNKLFKWITAGDISKDGERVLLKSYEKVYYWKRKNNEHIWQTLQRSPHQPNYQSEKQGEAIAFTADGKGYYTTSEGVFSPIYYYKTP